MLCIYICMYVYAGKEITQPEARTKGGTLLGSESIIPSIRTDMYLLGFWDSGILVCCWTTYLVLQSAK